MSKLNMDLTPEEMSVIEGALRTQEKILSLQAQADGNTGSRDRLKELQGLLSKLGRGTVPTPATAERTCPARSLFS
jgi:hypothetical protein